MTEGGLMVPLWTAFYKYLWKQNCKYSHCRKVWKHLGWLKMTQYKEESVTKALFYAGKVRKAACLLN